MKNVLLGSIFTVLCSVQILAAPGTVLPVTTFVDTSYPNVEPTYNYNFPPPVAADVLSQDPSDYTPSYGERYYMSIFGPRYKAVSSSNVGFFDFHKGMDITAVVTANGQDFDAVTPPPIISRCDGVVSDIADGSDAEMEQTGEGRYVEVRCDQLFQGNEAWGHIYMAYRHLASITPGLGAGDIINQGDIVGVMGESGTTSTVHLHHSIMRQNGQSQVNVNPMRTFDPQESPHLHGYLDSAEISQLGFEADNALFRIAVPYQRTAIRAVNVELLNDSYQRSYDFEAISATAGSLRDNNDFVDGLELFAYPYNRGHPVYRRFVDKMDDMPLPYPASPLHASSSYRPIINDDTGSTPAYVLDLLIKDLPLDYDLNDLQIEVIDIYGHGVRARGDSTATHPSVVFSRIRDGNNDAEESDSGVIDLTSSDLELVNDGNDGDQTVALRFPNVELPNNASINNAHIQFSADETDSGLTTLILRGEDVDSSAPLSSVSNNLSARVSTSTGVPWSPSQWSVVDETGTKQQTPDLSAIVQPVVNRQGWDEQSALTVLITGTGKRVADSAEGASYKDPYLYLEYDNDPQVNQPPQVLLDSPEDEAEIIGLAPVAINATASDSDGVITLVRFYVDDLEVGVDSDSPYSVDWQPGDFGSYQLHAVAEDDQGASTESSTVIVHVVESQLVIAIARGNDDVEEAESGAIDRNGSDLQLGFDSYVPRKGGVIGHQFVGLRFSGVPVPPGATVTRAYVQFTSTQTETDPVNIVIYGEYSGDAPALSKAFYTVSSRLSTVETVSWSPGPWSDTGLEGIAQQTPNISTVIQEIVNHPQWAENNALVLIVRAADEGENARTAKAYNGSSSQAPRLVIEYSLE